jgi:peptidoglycan-associated lipoprotein
MKKIALAFCALLALSGCSSSKKGMHVASTSSVSDFEKNVGDRVHFAFDKSDLTHEAKAHLARQAAWLNHEGRHTINVVIEGHADERGTREYNIALGERRADSVKRQLVADGVRADRIEVISYGKERPAVMGNTEEAYRLNRRAVTVLK